MRALFFALILLPGAVQADLFQISSKPDRVVVHPAMARIGRTIEIELPAGQHELRLSDLPGSLQPDFVDVRLQGAQLVSQSLRDEPVLTEERLAGSAAVQQARAALEAAQEAFAQHKDLIGVQLAQIEAAQAQIAFLEGLGQRDLTGDQLDTAQLRALGQAIAEDGAGARAVIVEAQARVRALQQESKKFEDAVALAQDAFDRVAVPFSIARELVLNVNVPQAETVSLEVDYFVEDVSWEPRYRLFLEPETGALSMERLVMIEQYSQEDWSGVDLSVTTIPILDQSAPSFLFERQLRIDEEIKLSVRSTANVTAEAMEQRFVLNDAEAVADPIIEAPVIVAEAAFGGASFSGAGVTYAFDVPVTVSTGNNATLALDGLSFETDILARAVPMRDETAYRMVSLTNDTGERVLAGSAELYVDGQIVGNTELATIEVGAEQEFGFGPILGLQLKRAILDREEGDRGFIARENREEEEVRISVENLTDQPWEVTLVDRVPYSEQEDLTIDWTASPKATRENVEDRRGILEWDLTLAPGQTQEVRLTKDIRWPEGQVLR